jgi:hypothetical protein
MMLYKQVATTLRRASSGRGPRLTTRYMSTSDTDEEKATLLNSYMQNLRLKDSLEPIAFTGNIPVVPLSDLPGKLSQQKVSVIGCGQVGMAIAFAILNQSAAGTIALVDTNASRLEGEAKDLEQGSGFHRLRCLGGQSSGHYHGRCRTETGRVATQSTGKECRDHEENHS